MALRVDAAGPLVQKPTVELKVQAPSNEGGGAAVGDIKESNDAKKADEKSYEEEERSSKQSKEKSKSSKKTWRFFLETVYKLNPNLKNGRLNLHKAQEGLRQAWLEFSPTIAGVANISGEKRTDSVEIAGQEKRETNWGYGLQLNQNLFASGGTQARIQKGRAAYDSALNGMYARESQVLLETFNAFLEVIVARELRDSAQSNQSLSVDLVNQAKTKVAAGEISPADLSLARANLAESQAKMAAAIARLEVAKAQLECLILTPFNAEELVWPDSSIFSLEDILPNGESTFDSTKERDAFALAVEKGNFTLKEAQRDVHATRYEVRSQLAQHMLPSADMQAELMKSDSDAKIGSGPDMKRRPFLMRVSAHLRIPLSLGRQQSLVRQSEQALSEKNLSFQQLILTTRAQALQAFHQRRSARSNMKRFKIEWEANEEALRAMQERYKQGDTTLINVTEVQARLLTSRQNYLEAQKQYMYESFRVRQLAGRFTAKDLRLAVAYYNPKDYNPRFGLTPKRFKVDLVRD